MADTRTLSTMLSRIADELSRDDLTGSSEGLALVRNAVRDAILHYQKHQFFVSEGVDQTITTVAGTREYAFPDDMISIEQVGLITSGNVFPIEYKTYGTVDDWDTSNPPITGEPYYYTVFANQIRLYPTPGQAYTLRLSGWVEIPYPATDDTSNYWTTEAEELIRHRAKYLLNLGVIHDVEAAKGDGILEREAFSNLTRKYIERTGIRMVRSREY